MRFARSKTDFRIKINPKNHFQSFVFSKRSYKTESQTYQKIWHLLWNSLDMNTYQKYKIRKPDRKLDSRSTGNFMDGMVIWQNKFAYIDFYVGPKKDIRCDKKLRDPKNSVRFYLSKIPTFNSHFYLKEVGIFNK